MDLKKDVPTSVATNLEPAICISTISVTVSSMLIMIMSLQLTMEMFCIINLDIMNMVAPSIEQSRCFLQLYQGIDHLWLSYYLLVVFQYKSLETGDEISLASTNK